MKIIITIITLLMTGTTYAVIDAQRVCVSIDKNAHNSIFTRRDNTAKMSFWVKYKRTGDITPSFLLGDKTKYYGTHKRTELRYGQPPVCVDVPIRDVYDRIWAFDNALSIGVQYGGDCNFKYQRGKTINATIHHRRGNLVEPWSCYIH